jgi:hypothetical protein
LDKKRRRYEKAVSDTVLIRVMVSDKYILKDIFEPFFQQKHGEKRQVCDFPFIMELCNDFIR